MADVFLSYAREDRSRADQIARGLTAMGLEVFWDTDIPPGQTWSDFIEGKLGESRSVVVLWSQHSTKSQWVREEARMGRDKSKLNPVIIDGSAPPLGFGEVQAADLTTWQGRTSDASWTRFANAVYAAARGSAPPQQAPQQHAAPPATPPRPVYSALSSGPESDPTGNLTPIGYIQKCLRMYMNGKGRARRAEYWWWIAFSIVVTLIAYFLDMAATGINSATGQPNLQIFYALVSVATLSPGIAVLARRFHDVGLNGWLVAAALGTYAVGALSMGAGMPAGGVLAAVALIAVLVIALIPSRPGDNQYGPNPKGV
jgi:uncharacterized membrane protein YhaH (DUF805 family)